MKRSVDAFVVGGGPAGLAAAIALRSAGMSVALADPAQPPIDKACGEGLMPAGIAALRALGITVSPVRSCPLKGICFCMQDSTVHAHFGHQKGLGVRRTVLHDALVERARVLGVQMLWRTRAEMVAHSRVDANGVEWSARWIIGADGQRSRVRQAAQLDQPDHISRRYGFRQHFAVAPWTDCVEVYWAPEGQAYITPIGKDEVCIALVVEQKQHRMASLPRLFPALAERLKGCRPVSMERGATTICRRLPRVTRGSVVLTGEAAGSIDAITGEGLTLAFQQALALGESLPREDRDLYERRSRQIRRIPLRVSRLMVFLGRHPHLQSRILRASQTDASFFAHFVEVHLDMRSLLPVSPGTLAGFGWNFVLG